MPPTRDQSERIIAARARFHAQWWDDPRLGVSIGTWLAPHDPQIQIFAQNLSGSPIASATAGRRSAGTSTSA